jgi:CubicO group peptidase (beta-lactamase class C family)
MRKGLLITAAAAAVAGTVAVQGAAQAADTAFCASQRTLVDQYVGPLVKPVSGPGTPGTPQAIGAMVVTLRLGEAPCFFHFGEIALGSGIAPAAQTIFELASVTKTFTTAILAMRAKDGVVDVNAPVAPHLPPGFQLDPRMQGVTFQQLATFTGGFPWSDPPGFRNEYTQEQFIAEVNALVPRNPIAGETNLPTLNYYSNGSLGLLGQALINMESEFGKYLVLSPAGYSYWVARHLTGPLQMIDTEVKPGGVWATGYAIEGDRWVVAPPFPFVPWAPAGALRSNAADMKNYLAANLCAYHAADPACAGLPRNILSALPMAHAPNDYTPSGTLKDPTIYTIDTKNGVPGENVQGYAWVYAPPPDPNPTNATALIWKDGGHPGFSSWIGFNPAKAYGIVILNNTGGVSPQDAGIKVIKETPP